MSAVGPKIKKDIIWDVYQKKNVDNLLKLYIYKIKTHRKASRKPTGLREIINV